MTITALNEHQSWWMLKLFKFDFNIKYRSEWFNSADSLLRRLNHRISEMKQSVVILLMLRNKLWGAFMQDVFSEDSDKMLTSNVKLFSAWSLYYVRTADTEDLKKVLTEHKNLMLLKSVLL